MTPRVFTMARTKSEPWLALLWLAKKKKEEKKKKKKKKKKSIFIRKNTDVYNANASEKPYGNQNKTQKVITAFRWGRKKPLTFSRLSGFKDGAKIYTENGNFVVVDKNKSFAKLWSEVKEASASTSTSRN